MTGVLEERHLSDGAIIPEKVLEFTFVATPTEALDRRSPRDPWVPPVLPLGNSLATHC